MNQARVAEPTTQMLFQRADRHEILRCPWIARARRNESWQRGTCEISQPYCLVASYDVAHFEAYESSELRFDRQTRTNAQEPRISRKAGVANDDEDGAAGAERQGAQNGQQVVGQI